MSNTLRSVLEEISTERAGWEVPESDSDDCSISMPFDETVLTFTFRDLPDYPHHTLVATSTTLRCEAEQLANVFWVLNSANAHTNFGALYIDENFLTKVHAICYEYTFESTLPDSSPEILADVLDEMYDHFSTVWSCLMDVLNGGSVHQVNLWLETVSDRYPN